VNDLMGVDEIRRNYQFWAFRYPTGLPIPVTSGRLRATLKETAKRFDPDGTNPAFNQMVIVGHSMGGILSRTMLQSSGDSLYNAMFTVPEDKLDLTDEERKALGEISYFEPLPFIRRAVFIAAPLRGSEVPKSSFLERMARRFISLPATWAASRASILKKNKKYLRPGLDSDDFITVARSSVDNLRSDSFYIKAVQDLPMAPGVPYHSIIAIQDATAGPGSDDKLVRYESAHLDGAQSEVLVPTWHSCLEHPMTVAEIRRILLLHLAELGKK
jgi:hypothetical protein